MEQLLGLLRTYRWLQCRAMKAFSRLGLTALIAAGACSSDPPEEKKIPTGEEVRSLYGLGPGSCYRYKNLTNGLFSTFDIAGPNTNSIAGRTTFVRKYSQDSGGRPVEEYFATDGDGEVRLIRLVDSAGMVKRYETDDVAPLFAKFAFNTKNEAIMKTGDRFLVNAQPKDMDAEMHEWTVLSDSGEAVLPDGMTATGYSLQYKINGGSTTTWSIVPDFGVASFTDTTGKIHQVCAARVCDAVGNCTGAESCSQLICN
jgi:hypothetical protein